MKAGIPFSRHQRKRLKSLRVTETDGTAWRKGEGWGLAALMLVLFGWTLAPLQGYDFWYYLAVGKELFEGGGIPWEESFLGTTRTLAFGRYADQTWLSSVYFYTAYLVGGVAGLVAGRSILLVAITGVTYRNCRLLGLSPWPAALWVTLGLWTVRARFLLRSYHFSDLGLALLVAVLLRYQQDEKRRIVSLGLLFCVWSNFHQGVIAGWIFLFLWVVFRGSSIKEGFKILVVVFLAALLRPHGWTFPLFLYDHFANQEAVTGVLEWGPLSGSQIVDQLGPFLVVSALLIILAWKKGGWSKEMPWHWLGIALAFTVLGIRSQRAVAEILPVSFPLLVPFFPRFAWDRRWLSGATVGLLALLLITRPLTSYQRLTRLYPHYPTRLTEAVKDEPGQVFNSYEYGSFLAFHQVPPFIHGTTSLFREKLVEDFHDVLNPTSQREKIIDEFGVTTFLLHYPTEVDATENLVNDLARNPNWQLWAWDDSGLLFRRGPASEGLTATFPWREQKWSDKAAARRELEQLVQEFPSARAYLMLCRMATEEKDWSAALDFSGEALKQDPSYYPAWQARSVAAANLGERETLLEATKQAVRFGDFSPQAHFSRALALLAVAQESSGLKQWWLLRQSRSHLRSALEIEPGMRPARELLTELGG